MKNILKKSYIRKVAAASARARLQDVLDCTGVGSCPEEDDNGRQRIPQVPAVNAEQYAQILGAHVEQDAPIFGAEVEQDILQFALPAGREEMDDEMIVDDYEFEPDENSDAESISSIESDNHSSDPSSSDRSDSESEDNEPAESLQDALQVWSSQYNITNVATSALLAILRRHGHPDLPQDSRTLKKTPRQKTPIKVLENGEYVHVGLKQRIMSKLNGGFLGDIIELDVNCDGISLHKSNATETWPLLGRCRNFKDPRPFVIGLFRGEGKPQPLAHYLADYIHEVRELTRDGVAYDGRNLQFRIPYYLCDAPARAYLKCVKGHTAYFGCEGCDQEGDWTTHIVFDTVCGQLRTDETFRSRRNVDHHVGTSPLEEELDTGMVSQFPRDPMHLSEIGVMKRFVTYSTAKAPAEFRLRGELLQDFSDLLEQYADFIPSEFSRKPRSFRHIGKWKATEWRLLLLYVGVVVFQMLLKPEVYKIFMLYHCATFALSSEALKDEFLEQARDWLLLFVPHSAEIFTPNFVSYNVHSLMHLPDDVEQYGTLIDFSAYPFESKLGAIKKLVRSSAKPLQQIAKRLSERDKVETKIKEKKKRGLLYEHYDGPTANIENVAAQYKKLELEVYSLRLEAPNNTVCFSDGKFGSVANIVQTDAGEVKIIARLFQSVENLYSYPISSSDLGVCRVRDLTEQFHVYNIDDITYKCQLKQYSIVDFIEDDGPSVAVVPHKWIDDSNKHCFYPKETASKSVEAYHDPDDLWGFYPCVVRKTYDSYSEARQRLKRAEDTDGLESAVEQGRGKRKRFANSKYMEDDENDSDVDNPSYDKYEQIRNKNIKEMKLALSKIMGDDDVAPGNKKNKAILKGKTGKKTPQTHNSGTRTPDTDQLQTTADAKKRIEARARMISAQRAASRSKLRTVVQPSSSRDIPEPEMYGDENTSPVINQEGASDILGSDIIQSDPTTQLESNPVSTTVQPGSTRVNAAALKQAALLQFDNGRKSQGSKVTYNISNNAARDVTLLKPADTSITLESLRHALDSIWSAIENLMKVQETTLLNQKGIDEKLDKILRSVRATETCKKPSSWPKELPLGSLVQMYKFENDLNDPAFMKFAIDHFSTSGGKTSEEMARSVCISLFSKTLACNLNLKGTTIKTGLKDLKIFIMIIDACKLALAKNFDLKSARAAVGAWLRNQSARRDNQLQLESGDEDDIE